jgi:toxin ParE1/3/4
MNVVYSPRSIQDLERLATYYRTMAGSELADKVGRRIQVAIQRLADHPLIGATIDGRADVHVLMVSKYPYRIFYRVSDDAVEILHIRHTARQSRRGE